MEALDPRNTGEGRTGPDRKLDLRTEVEMIGDYRAGVKVKAIYAKFRISPWLFNETLKRHGVSRTRRKKSPAALTS